MNLFIRLFVRWLLSRNQRLVPGAVSEQHYRILPHDMGWRNHLPNFRFLSFMELGRFSYWRGIRDELKQSTGMRLIAAQEMIYIRPVGFMARLKMETSLIGWDQKYVYFRHDFYVGNKLV
ncbi:MAG: thioesterase family protein, partial [Thalassolituus sp.]